VAVQSVKVARWMSGAVAFTVLVGCVTEPAPQRMKFGELALADHVRVSEREAASHSSVREVSDAASIAAYYEVVASRPDGWHRPWTESPKPRYTVSFSRAGKEIGSYGVGSNYIIADGYVRNLAGADLRAVLSLLRADATPP
jgi:hypothetical protein